MDEVVRVQRQRKREMEAASIALASQPLPHETDDSASSQTPSRSNSTPIRPSMKQETPIEMNAGPLPKEAYIQPPVKPNQMTPELVQHMLETNKELIELCKDLQNNPTPSSQAELQRTQMRLQSNLKFLSSLADVYLHKGPNKMSGNGAHIV